MDLGLQQLLLVLLGVLLGAGTLLAWRVSERQLRGESSAVPPAAIPASAGDVLAVLRSSAVLIGEYGAVLQASAHAYHLGLVREGELQSNELLDLVRQVRRDGQIRDTELVIRSANGSRRYVQGRVAPLRSRLILVLAEDRTRERQVEAVRRDFVANISHEIKTPVGAMAVLAEAIEGVADDPEAVRELSERMAREAARLGSLVQQIIALSRLQGGAGPEHPTAVDVDAVVEQAIDSHATEAARNDITLEFEGQHGKKVWGSQDQILLALNNLVSNAVRYSDSGGRVVVTATSTPDDMVDIVVTDTGIGIPPDDLERVFERFYRVDPARHRSTGGTGLGLSIVKHVAASHGGEVTAWSVEGEGSSLTLRLPRDRTTPDGGAEVPSEAITELDTSMHAVESPTQNGAPAGVGRGSSNRKEHT